MNEASGGAQSLPPPNSIAVQKQGYPEDYNCVQGWLVQFLTLISVECYRQCLVIRAAFNPH